MAYAMRAALHLRALKYINMIDPLLFVPLGENKVFSLYEVFFTEDYSDLTWNILTLSGQSQSIDEKLENLQEYFKQRQYKKEIGGNFQGNNTTDGSVFKELTDSTPSIFLGLFLAAVIKIQQRKLKSSWNTVTVTGDLEYNRTTGEMNFVTVGDIVEKYKAVEDYAKKHKGKHLFVYVSNETEIEPDFYENNLEVKAFVGGYSVGAIIAEILKPNFDEEQTRLFDKCKVNLPWEYISTWVFEEIKKESLSSDWKGFLIHGEGETGKSAMTLALARYLAAAEKIYAPIWVKIENESLQQYIEKPKLMSDPLENQDPLIDNPIAAYIAKTIVETLNKEPGAGNELSRTAKLIDRGNAAPYLLVIDNLELDCVIEVMNAVQIILGGVKNKPPIIITSRFDEKEPGSAQRIGLKNKPQDEAALSPYGVESLVDAVSRGQTYEYKLAKNKASEEYHKFISSLYLHFNSFPGVITQITPLLAYREFSDLNPILLSMKDMQFQEKINTVYQIIFSQLDDFTQMVLFAFINTIVNQSFEKYIDDIQADPQEIAEHINSYKWTFTDGTSLELSEIQEKIPNALIELERSHLIYRTTQNRPSDKAGYSIKTLPYISFMFEESLEGRIINGKSLRDILLNNLPDIVWEGLRCNQPVSKLKKYLERMKNENEDCFNFALLCVAASVSDRPEHIDLLLESGYELNITWERESSRNPVQCAALYNNNPSILQRLIDRGADYKSTDKFGMTPLHLAAANNSNPKVIDILIDKGLDMYARDDSKKTPLQYAAKNPNKSIIEMFYNKGADIKKVFSDNVTLLHYAAVNKNPEIAGWLINKGLDIHAVEKNGWTPLHYALFIDNNTEMINFLLDRGAISDINKIVDINPPWYLKFMEYWPLLHLVAFRNKTSDNIDLLIEKGAEIDFKDKNGSTPLHFAAEYNKEPDMINFLLKHHASINEKDKKGRTPVFLAAQLNENPQVAIALIKAGAKLDNEVQWKSIFYRKKNDTALKRLKKRKDWPLIEAAINA